jgi:hypothetical protein
MLLGLPDAQRQRVIAAHAADPRPGWEGPLVEELRRGNPLLITQLEDGDRGGGEVG